MSPLVQDQREHYVHTSVALRFLGRLRPDNMYLIFLFLWYAYCKFVFLLLANFTFLMFALCSGTYSIQIRVFAYITVAVAFTLFTLCHFLFPQFRRSTYQYLPFSIYYYLLHSIPKSVPSNQKGFHSSL